MANKELKSIKFPGLVDTYTVNSMPNGASANQQLATDSEGVVKWEEKPFFYAEYGEDITWDGDTTDREIFVLEQFSFYKVSDTIYTTGTISGRKFTVLYNGGESEYQIDEHLFKTFPNIPNLYFVMPVGNPPYIVFGSANEDINFPGGLFFFKNDDPNFYVNYLSGTANKTIDPLYLPEITAELLPDIPADKLPKQYKISINPDNSCSVSFTDAYNMVNSGLASFSLVAWGDGKYMQISYTIGSQNISGTIQRAIIAELIHITDSASGLSIAELVWGESSGISVTKNTISAQ